MTATMVDRNGTDGSAPEAARAKVTAKPRRYRRKLNELDKIFHCPVRYCIKRYGSITALRLHMTMKHNVKTPVNVAPLPNTADSPLQSSYDCGLGGILPEMPNHIESPRTSQFTKELLCKYSPLLDQLLDRSPVDPVAPDMFGPDAAARKVPPPPPTFSSGAAGGMGGVPQCGQPHTCPVADSVASPASVDLQLGDWVSECLRLMPTCQPASNAPFHVQDLPGSRLFGRPDPTPARAVDPYGNMELSAAGDINLGSILSSMHDDAMPLLGYM